MTKKPLSSRNKPEITMLTVLFTGLVLLLGLMGCGGGSDGPPPPLPDQDASGLYKDGTAELDGGTLMLNDLRGFVHNGRIIMFSITGHVLFDGQVNTLLSDDYDATVDVYENGVKTQSDVSVTGNVLTESRITGNISGTGKANGSFTLTFDLLYSRGASFARVETNAPSSSFTGNIMSAMAGATTPNFDIEVEGVYDMVSLTPSFISCLSDGTYTIPDSSINIYSLNETITQTDPECTMSETPDYTGFAAAVDDASIDDTLVYAVTNGTNAQFAVLAK